ncbi:MAG: hypothetical protein V2A53_05940, partial [bacterium]
IGEPIYQDFITEKAYSLVNSDLGDGVTYNWFYAEYLTESPTMPKIGTGGGLIEYKKDTSGKWPEFSSDYIKLMDKIQKRISPKPFGGLANNDVIPYIIKDKCKFILAKDTITVEKKKNLIRNYLGPPIGYWRVEGANYLIQHKALLHTILGDTPAIRERDRIFGLSEFYIIQEPNLDYFSSYLGTQSTKADWFKGIEAKVGSPLNDCSVFDEGWDPSVPEAERHSYDKYIVYIREYTNALILIKLRPSSVSKSYGTDSATSYTFDRDYFLLHSDGSTEGPIRTISLPNSSGVILLKETQDTTPPAPICDLSADASTPKAVFLTWTAKGDDGDTGRASFYDIRYSLSPITEENFNSAEPVSFPWHLLPELSGAIDGITACNLLSDTTYYFVLKVLDEADNASSISNCVSIRTLTEPIPGGNFPHIKTYLSLPSAGLTEEQVKWEADHFDFVVFGGDIPRGNLPTYKKYNPKILGVCYTCPDSIYDINSNNSYANRLKKRCEEAHVDFEDMFVHFAEDTRIKMGGVEGVINGWDTVNDSDNNGTVSDDELPFINGSATARNREEARVLGGWGGWARTHFKANMGHSFYRQTLVDFIQERMEQDLEGGVKWDGIYFDCLGTDDLPVPGVITGGEIIEYPDTRNYAEDYIQFLNETRKKIKNKIMRGAAADKLFIVHSKIDAIGSEFFFKSLSSIDTFESNSNLLNLERIWGPRFFIKYWMSFYEKLGTETEEIMNRDKILGLAYFYLVAAPRYDYYQSWSGPYGSAMVSKWWTKACEFDVGSPLGDWYVFAEGKDPSDIEKNYKVYARRYTKALILAKPIPAWNYKSYGTDSTTLHILDKTYRPLKADKTLGEPISTISLRNAEGAILIPQDSPLITLKKTCDKKYAAKGGTLTYTITYTNEGSGTATDVVIIEVLPNNCKLQIANFKLQNVEVSYWMIDHWQETCSESATKIKWLIPTVASAEAGSISFCVKVE